MCATYIAGGLRQRGYDMPRAKRDKVNLHVKENKDLTKPQKKATLTRLDADDDARMKGVVHTLVWTRQEVKVSRRDLQPGNCLQYWLKGKKVSGRHCEFFEKVLKQDRRIVIHDCHT